MGYTPGVGEEPMETLGGAPSLAGFQFVVLRDPQGPRPNDSADWKVDRVK